MMRSSCIYLLPALLLLAVAGFAPWGTWSLLPSQAMETKPAEKKPAVTEAGLELKRQQLDARETALAARELQLNAMAADLGNRAREQEAVRKKLAAAQEEQKKLNNERAKKTLKIYRTLKPEEAARLLDRLDESTAVGILNALDQKTVTQLFPYLNQSRVLKWTRETLAGA